MTDILPQWSSGKVTCPECGRVFDLSLAIDSQEWYYGHDCEENSDER